MRLRRIRIVNYKAFEDFTFEPDTSGLTAIIGPNGSGKTSLWEVVSLVSRLANDWQYGWLERQFRGRARSFVGCLPWRDSAREMLFELDIEDGPKSTCQYSVGWAPHPDTGLPQLSTDQLIWQGDKVISYDRVTGRYSPSRGVNVRWHFVERGYPLLLSTVARQALAGTKLQGVKEVFDWIATWGVFRFRILDSMKDFDDLALERGQSDALTTTGDNLARMLYAWKEQPNGEALQAISDVFKLLLQRSDYHNVGWDVKAEVAGGTVYLSVRLYKEDDPDKWHELAFGPDGFKAVLLLASALLSRKSLILVEEPETHLDARLMDLIADMFLQGAKAGKQVIFTTHSPLLAQQVPAACIRVLSRTGSTTLPEEVIQSQQVLTAWLSDVLHERAARP